MDGDGGVDAEDDDDAERRRDAVTAAAGKILSNARRSINIH